MSWGDMTLVSPCLHSDGPLVPLTLALEWCCQGVGWFLAPCHLLFEMWLRKHLPARGAAGWTGNTWENR